jgi:hypothetical protein
MGMLEFTLCYKERHGWEVATPMEGGKVGK